MRAAIYARFSTDMQSDRSIEDQVELCRDFCEREQLIVTAVFDDRAKSGASIFGRPGLGDLMERAKQRTFDVLVVEHPDRIARSQRDLPDIHERLKFYGISIRAVHSGSADLDTLAIGLFGLVGQMQREDGAKKVHRGMAGVVREGRHAGGRAYGYRPVAGSRGILAIVDHEANVIRRIFKAYITGDVPRTIAGALNREGIAPPRGRVWNASTINGNGQRGNGILQNELYAGRIVWNKVQMVKNPETGRRVSRANPRTEWRTTDKPELAIIDPVTFAVARAARSERSRLKPQERRQPKRLLSGLLKCGSCGSGMSIHDRDKTGKTRLRCSRVRESGSCSHARLYYAEAIERGTVDGLQSELRNPDALAAFLKEYRAERQRLASDAAGKRLKLEARFRDLTRALDRMVDAIIDGSVKGATIKVRMEAAEVEKAAVEAELAAIHPSDVAELHPQAIDRYLSLIQDLSAALTDETGVQAGSPAIAFRRLVESVVIYPVMPRAPLDIEVRGFLAELTGNPGYRPSGHHRGFEVVAEEGLEPPTRGL